MNPEMALLATVAPAGLTSEGQREPTMIQQLFDTLLEDMQIIALTSLQWLSCRKLNRGEVV
jgi:hypothetical protein